MDLLDRGDTTVLVVQGNRVLTEEDFEKVVLPPAGLESFPLDADFQAGFVLNRDSPDQTNFPRNSSFWDTVKYNPAFQGRQMRPDSLKFPVFI